MKSMRNCSARHNRPGGKLTLSAFCVLFTIQTVFAAASPYGAVLGTFNGVTIYSNGTKGDAGIYQCVELVRRYYLQVYHIDLAARARGNANTFFSNASALGLSSYADGGTMAPQVGDILPSNGGPEGHVAIVRGVSSNQVCVAQQNFTNGPDDANWCMAMAVTRGHYTISGFNRSNNAYPIQGWLRIPTAFQPGDFNLSLPVVYSSIIQGRTTVFTINVQSTGNFSGTVNLAAINLPSGYDTARTTLNPSTLTPLANGAGQARLVLATTASTQTGTFNIIIRATSGTKVKQQTATVVIDPLQRSPQIGYITILTSPVAGRQFFVSIIGSNFDLNTVRVVVTGPGCTSFGPCNVPNSQ